MILLGMFVGFVGWFLVRYLMAGIFTVDQNERAVKTAFGRAERIGGQTTLDDPVSEMLTEEEKLRYCYPQVRVIPPGGPYFKWPWEKVYKTSIAVQTVSMAYDPEDADANEGGTRLSAVTKDQLDTGLSGQLRFRISERNLYAWFFGVKNPIAHVMGFFISVLRERIANFEAPAGAAGPDSDGMAAAVAGISINDLRKNLSSLNEHMDRECAGAAARYGIALDASLITSIDPPPEVESALAAINTAHNQVSSDISLAQAHADQKIVQSRRAVEIETLNAQAEVEPLLALAGQVSSLQASGDAVLPAYLRNVKLSLFRKAGQVILEEVR
ncbi:MAG: SPFH domain-containing protein [Verrucomicrobia bacterium]|nr:SPFH domain-containing protein [Verrucomicrobiota bacterium]